jgi:TorA maturation chaperone TorD
VENATAAERTARCQVYRLAARLLAGEVDPPLYRRLRSDEVTAGFGEVGLPAIDPAIRGLDEDEALTALSVEFCRLFVGPRPACPPYASAWLGDVLLGGRAAGRLLELLDRHGLTVTVPDGLPVLAPDHLSVELAVLCELYHTAAARELLDRHLLGWAVPYLRDLEGEARLSPYRSMARLTAALLATEGGAARSP